jgi:hypothetical protein
LEFKNITAMAAPLNNNFWTLRSKHGRDLIIANPKVLLEAAGEYFDYVDANPWFKMEAIKGGDAAGTLVKIPTQQPYTLKGLCHFLDIDFSTWGNYKERENFKPIIEKIEDYVYNQKFAGAAVGAFNANLIARDLGLVDKKDVTSDNEGLGFFALLKQTSKVKEIANQ